jgi:hypothetical protein
MGTSTRTFAFQTNYLHTYRNSTPYEINHQRERVQRSMNVLADNLDVDLPATNRKTN